MFKQKFIVGFAAFAVLILGISTESFAFAVKPKKEFKFKVRIENISASEGLVTTEGKKYPFALSPGMFVVNHKKQHFFKLGKNASVGLEAQAEDGNPEVLSKDLLTKVGSIHMDVFNKPLGSEMPAPILPGGVYEFTFTAKEGMRFNLIAMYGQSNDLFYAPEQSLELFDKNGNAITGDITDKLLLWDAGTEVNQAPGIGAEQAPRQKTANTGTGENAVVGMVKDSFSYPNTKDVLRVTLSVE